MYLDYFFLLSYFTGFKKVESFLPRPKRDEAVDDDEDDAETVDKDESFRVVFVEDDDCREAPHSV